MTYDLHRTDFAAMLYQIAYYMQAAIYCGAYDPLEISVLPWVTLPI